MVLAFHRALACYPYTSVEMVMYTSQFFRVDYVRVKCRILGSTSETGCAQKRKIFRGSFSEAVSLDVGFARECVRETKPSGSSLALCAQSLELLRLLM